MTITTIMITQCPHYHHNATTIIAVTTTTDLPLLRHHHFFSSSFHISCLKIFFHLPGTCRHHHYNHLHAHFPFSYTFVFIGLCVARTVFYRATVFNSNISSWDVSSVVDMYASKCLKYKSFS